MELVRGTIIPFEEDKEYEFKMHLDLCEDDLPVWLRMPQRKRTRRAISRNINGFLNSGKGGTILLGVQDDGEVKGLSFSIHQKDHIYIALEDLLNRYIPPVPLSLYKLNFIPVVDELQEFKETMKWTPPSRNICSSLRAHLIRSSKPCWCFNNAKHELNTGRASSKYVAEITIFPTLPIIKPHLPPLRPLFSNEDGDAFVRKCASVWKMSYSEVIQMTREEVTQYLKKVEK